MRATALSAGAIRGYPPRMGLNIRKTPLLIWLAVACIATLSCTLTRPATHLGNEYFPLGVDSFYHAVRILAAVDNPDSFYEFDPKIHAPEGSLLVWPWGYDYAIATIIRAARVVGLGSDPLMIMLWIPVVAVFAATGLLMLVGRRVGLGNWTMALAGFCLALSSSTQLLYGFGQIDHHYAEHLCILASLATGLAWFRASSVTSSITLGIVFGLALAIHNALFILQVPFLATALLLWLHGKRIGIKPLVAFVTALFVSTLAVLLPSQPFQEGRFEFYLLSWFHLYIVGCTAVVTVLLAGLQPNRRNIGVLALVALVLLAPLINQITYARSFVDGSLGMLDEILEMRSPLQLLRDGQLDQVFGFYSFLFVLAPVTFVLCVIRCWRERNEPRVLFWIWCVFGLALMTTQIRMHYFGVFALFMPWLVVAQEQANKQLELRKRTLLIASLLFVLAYAPVIRHGLVAPIPRGGDEGFMPLYPVFEPLRKACKEDPGIVLADTNAGHYIRYFSECSVIANNFLLTAQHFQKADEVNRLFSLPVEQLIQQAPYVKYVLVRAGEIKAKRGDQFDYAFFGRFEPVANKTLLLAPADAIPSQFKLVYEVTMRMRKANSAETRDVPYAKLYKIEGRTMPASVNDVGE